MTVTVWQINNCIAWNQHKYDASCRALKKEKNNSERQEIMRNRDRYFTNIQGLVKQVKAIANG